MNVLWLMFYGRMNGKPQLRSLWRKSNLEDVKKIILMECEDKDGCKGGGFVCEI